MGVGIGAALDDGQYALAEPGDGRAGGIGGLDVLDGVVEEGRDGLVLIGAVTRARWRSPPAGG